MKCSRCHSENPDTSRFCANCAAPLSPEGQDLPSFTKTIVPPVPALEKGTLFAKKYRISGESGRGGMGVVFKAEDTKLKRSVALKLLPMELSHFPDAKERLTREAQAAAADLYLMICDNC